MSKVFSDTQSTAFMTTSSFRSTSGISDEDGGIEDDNENHKNDDPNGQGSIGHGMKNGDDNNIRGQETTAGEQQPQEQSSL